MRRGIKQANPSKASVCPRWPAGTGGISGCSNHVGSHRRVGGNLTDGR